MPASRRRRCHGVDPHEGFEIAIAPEIVQSFSGTPTLSLRATGLDALEPVSLAPRPKAPPCGDAGRKGAANGGKGDVVGNEGGPR